MLFFQDQINNSINRLNSQLSKYISFFCSSNRTFENAIFFGEIHIMTIGIISPEEVGYFGNCFQNVNSSVMLVFKIQLFHVVKYK